MIDKSVQSYYFFLNECENRCFFCPFLIYLFQLIDLLCVVFFKKECLIKRTTAVVL